MTDKNLSYNSNNVVCGEMVNFDELEKMIKISGKVDKSLTTGLVVIFRSLFKEKLLQTECIHIHRPHAHKFMLIYPKNIYLYIYQEHLLRHLTPMGHS